MGEPESVNEVHLRGRVSGTPQERELPSGDRLVELRLVVARESAQAARGRVDTIDVTCWSGRTRQVARRLQPADVVEVRGSLRRRFFRTPTGPASRYQVEADRLARVHRPDS